MAKTQANSAPLTMAVNQGAKASKAVVFVAEEGVNCANVNATLTVLFLPSIGTVLSYVI